MVRFFSLAFAGWLLLPLTAGAQAHPAAAAPDSVTQQTPRRLAASPALPGFAVAVVGSGGIRYEAGFGLADRAARAAFTPCTVQEVGSVSKTLIGLCLLKGVELGYFTLDTDVNTVLPGWTVRNPHGGPGAAPITIRHLATHTAGILDREKLYVGTYTRHEAGCASRM